MWSGRIYGPYGRFFACKRRGGIPRGAGAPQGNESDGTLWIFPPLPWTNNALDSAARVR